MPNRQQQSASLIVISIIVETELGLTSKHNEYSAPKFESDLSRPQTLSEFWDGQSDD